MSTIYLSKKVKKTIKNRVTDKMMDAMSTVCNSELPDDNYSQSEIDHFYATKCHEANDILLQYYQNKVTKRGDIRDKTTGMMEAEDFYKYNRARYALLIMEDLVKVQKKISAKLLDYIYSSGEDSE